jgi:hypothetical protein
MPMNIGDRVPYIHPGDLEPRVIYHGHIRNWCAHSACFVVQPELAEEVIHVSPLQVVRARQLLFKRRGLKRSDPLVAYGSTST